MIRIASLIVYPVKACGGYEVDACRVVPGGLESDRRYMIIDETGRMVTRREETRLSQISLLPTDEGFAVSAKGSDTSPLHLPLAWEDASEEFSDSVQTSIWSDSASARVHKQGSLWFRHILKRDVRLVYLPDESLRQVNPARAAPSDVVSFADGYPILLTSKSSLDDLNSRLETPIFMERFRPNVVVSGAPSFAEDEWATITLGSIPCVAPKLCDRCVVTTIAEGSSEKSKEPLKTLATFRRWNGAVWFGTNVIPRAAGTLAVGDAVVVDEIRPHPAKA